MASTSNQESSIDQTPEANRPVHPNTTDSLDILQTILSKVQKLEEGTDVSRNIAKQVEKLDKQIQKLEVHSRNMATQFRQLNSKVDANHCAVVGMVRDVNTRLLQFQSEVQSEVGGRLQNIEGRLDVLESQVGELISLGRE